MPRKENILNCSSRNDAPIKFAKINECQVSEVDLYLNTVYLTFDIDWACDGVLLDTIELIEDADVSATWFVTHDTPLLQRLRDNPKFELGIHPNFNFLLQGSSQNGHDAEEVIDRLLKIVPEAKSVRSHSMTQSSKIVQLFHEKGLIYDCNYYVPEQANILLRPWYLWNGLIKVPHFWEDDAVCIYEFNTPIKDLLLRNGLKVFDFHPIHIFLNTELLDRYENTRSLHQNPKELIKHRYDGYGTRNRLIELLEMTK